MKSLAPAPGQRGTPGDKPPEFWGGNVSASQVGYLVALLNLSSRFDGGLLLASHLKKDLGRPAFLAALPPAQWFCDGSSPRRRRGGLGPVPGVCVLTGMCACVRVYVHVCEERVHCALHGGAVFSIPGVLLALIGLVRSFLNLQA